MSAHQPSPRVVITALGFAQILAWGTSFYFPAVLAAPIVADTGWSLAWVVGGTSIGLLVAGLISPQVGRLVHERGGRPVLAASSVLFAAGLAGIGLAPSLPFYLIAWIVLGAGMGCGLYDAAFAALGRLYGHGARGPITNLTLFGGFASTVCWPLSAFLADTFGWREACLVYAAMHLVVALPLQLVMPAGRAHEINHDTNHDADDAPVRSEPRETRALAHEQLILVLLALVMTLAAGIGSIVVVHLLIFLQARGVELAMAVTFGTLFGPAQVGARVLERVFGQHYHPIWTMIASCALMFVGLLLLMISAPILAIAILLYGAGYGISWIARGTLPLALFGPQRYPILIGRLAFPSLIAQALSPALGALLLEHHGADATIAVLTAFAAVNLVVIGLLWRMCRNTLSPP
jgi:predicted MFS family arabinose efflux permease